MTGSMMVIATAVVLASACTPEAVANPASPAATPASDPVAAMLASICSSHNCGANSARVNDTLLGALAFDGKPNQHGFSIDRTLHPPPGVVDHAAFRLDVQDGRLVGVDDKGGVIAGDELKGRWFYLHRQPPPSQFRSGAPGSRRGKIRIVDVGYVHIMADRQLRTTSHAETTPSGRVIQVPDALASRFVDTIVVGYDLAYEPDGDAAPGPRRGPVSLCPDKAQLVWTPVVTALPPKVVLPPRQPPLVRPAAPAPTHAPPTSRSPAEQTPAAVADVAKIGRPIPLDRPVAFVFVLGEETYDETTATVEPAKALNIACPGTALSKLKLMGYDPQDRVFVTKPPQRQAALKMLTARYCGEDSFTVDGEPLFWNNQSGWFDWSPRGSVEAVWDQKGAICLNEPRLPEVKRAVVVEYCASRGRTDIRRCDSSLDRRPPNGAEFISIIPPPPLKSPRVIEPNPARARSGSPPAPPQPRRGAGLARRSR